VIDALHRGADAVVGLAGVALVHGTLLAAAAALLAATVLRRARPAVHAALWAVVLLKFVVPIGPGARFSLASLVDRATAEPPPEVVMVFSEAPAAPVAAVAPPAPRHPVAVAGVGLWLLAALALGLRQLRRYRGARRAALALPVAPAEVRAELAALAHRLGVRRSVDARLAPTGAPYVIGLRAPVLVLPAGLLADPARRTAALAHELAHVRRADGALRVLQLLAATLFFFWPVVRWVNRRLDLAREQACDAYAIAVGPLDGPAYARMLIAVARSRVPAAALGLGGSQLARRVGALTQPRRAGLGLGGAVAVAGFAAIGLTSAAAANTDAGPLPERPCYFTPEVAAEIMASYPEADVDGDGALTRAEVCDFQQELRRRYVIAAAAELPVDAAARDLLVDALPMGVVGGVEASPLASDDLCCDCSAPSGQPAEFNHAIATCTSPRGVAP
jgi:beta-lactamase regulating signal transducer with metallopeptidase domain